MLGHKEGLRVVLVTAWADNAFDVVADVVTHTGLQLEREERVQAGGEVRALAPIAIHYLCLCFLGRVLVRRQRRRQLLQHYIESTRKRSLVLT